ncbi:MAG: ribosome maturation factor RimM [Cyanobacteria bacterium J06626_18]
MADMSMEDWLEIGRIVAPQGLDGAVRVYPNSDFPERFLEPGDRWIFKPGRDQPEPIQLLAGRYLEGKGLYVLKLQGITHRDHAEALREARLLVPRSDRLAIEPGEFHVADLVGLQVRLQATGTAIGAVVDVYAAGNDLLAIELTAVKEAVSAEAHPKAPARRKARKKPTSRPQPILIPFVYEIVPVVDLEAGYVEISPPKGLIPNLEERDE